MLKQRSLRSHSPLRCSVDGTDALPRSHLRVEVGNATVGHDSGGHATGCRRQHCVGATGVATPTNDYQAQNGEFYAYYFQVKTTRPWLVAFTHPGHILRTVRRAAVHDDHPPPPPPGPP